MLMAFDCDPNYLGITRSDDPVIAQRKADIRSLKLIKDDDINHSVNWPHVKVRFHNRNI